MHRLIAASVGTVAHYGFRCHSHIGQMYLLLCLLSGIAGTVFPFMEWFDQHEYKVSFSCSSVSCEHR